MASIRLLSYVVCNSMCSGILLFDLTQVVEELVFNNLDAGLTKVFAYLSVKVKLKGESC